MDHGESGGGIWLGRTAFNPGDGRFLLLRADLPQIEISSVHPAIFGRNRGEKLKGQSERLHRIAELGTRRTIPGYDGIKSTQLLNQPGGWIDLEHVESRGGDRTGAVDKSYQRQVLCTGPDFEVIGSEALHGRQR